MFTVITASTKRYNLRPTTSYQPDDQRIAALVANLRHDLGQSAVTHLDDTIIVKIESGFVFGEIHTVKRTIDACDALTMILKILEYADITSEATP